MKKMSFMIILCLGLIYWQLWLPSPKVANDFPLISSESLKSYLDFPRVWLERGSGGLGEYIVYSIWPWPFALLTGLFAWFGMSFIAIEKIFYFIPSLLLGTLGLGYLSKKNNLSEKASFIAGILYLTNTYFILLLDGGQLMLVLAYGFFPWAYIAVTRAIEGDFKAKVLAGGGMFLVSVFDIRVVFILFILTFIKFIFELFFARSGVLKWFSRWVTTGVVVGVVFVALNAYWVFLMVQHPLSGDIYQTLTQISGNSYVKLGHTILLLSPHWPNNIYGQITQLKIEFVILPILAFFGLVLNYKNRHVVFWSMVAVIGVFLAKGEGEPFSQVYRFLYLNVPGFSLFRDSTKFLFLVALSYSILIAFCIDKLEKRFSKGGLWIAVVCFSYVLWLIRPVWLGQMSGLLSNQPLQFEFSHLAQTLSADKNFSRVLWVPRLHPLSYSNIDHTSVDAIELAEKRPFAINNRGRYELLNFIREAPFMGELFDVFGIGYIAYPPFDPRRADLHPDNIRYYHLFLSQLRDLAWAKDITEQSKVPLIKTKQSQDRIFIANNLWFVIGSDEIYRESTKSAELKLANNALTFSEERVELCNRLDEYPEAKVTMYKKTSVDLFACFFKRDSLIFLSKQLSDSPDKGGWWKRDTKDFAWFKDFLANKYSIDNQDFDLGGGWAIAEGDLKLKLDSEKIESGKILFARVMENPRGGKILFMQDGKILGEINTLSNEANMRWYRVGNVVSDKSIMINSQGEINVVNAIGIIDEKQLQGIEVKMEGYKNRVVEYSPVNVLDRSAKLNYQRLSPTAYKISISDLKGPSYLVLSESYNDFWRLGDSSPLPVYSLLNAYRIEKDGEYILEYSLQKNVFTGLIVSIISAGVVLIILLKK